MSQQAIDGRQFGDPYMGASKNRSRYSSACVEVAEAPYQTATRTYE